MSEAHEHEHEHEDEGTKPCHGCEGPQPQMPGQPRSVDDVVSVQVTEMTGQFARAKLVNHDTRMWKVEASLCSQTELFQVRVHENLAREAVHELEHIAQALRHFKVRVTNQSRIHEGIDNE